MKITRITIETDNGKTMEITNTEIPIPRREGEGVVLAFKKQRADKYALMPQLHLLVSEANSLNGSRTFCFDIPV